MSSQRHLRHIKSPARQIVMGVTLAGLGLLAACAGPPAMDTRDTLATTTQAPPGLDQDPIDAPVTKVNITNLPTERAAAPEEPDMTVLVLEDHHLIALASRMSTPANLAEAAPVRPDEDRFQFAFDAHRLDAEAEAILRRHGQYLKANPEQKLRLNTHTDAQGAESYNRFLSRLRATAAVRILKEEGAREEQIETHAFGSDRPIAKGDHDANRRLELIYEDSHLALGKDTAEVQKTGL